MRVVAQVLLASLIFSLTTAALLAPLAGAAHPVQVAATTVPATDRAPQPKPKPPPPIQKDYLGALRMGWAVG
jgi:hypothetical protein